MLRKQFCWSLHHVSPSAVWRETSRLRWANPPTVDQRLIGTRSEKLGHTAPDASSQTLW